MRALFLLGLLGVLGCEDPDASIFVDLRTDFVPGAEFGGVRTTVLDDAEAVEGTREAVAARGEAFLDGVRVAEIEGLTQGPKRIRIELVGLSGEAVATRHVRLNVGGPTGVSVLMTRSCLGVSCPGSGDDPALTECRGGACVVPECTLDNRAACGAASCGRDDECGAVASCAAAACDEGACIARPVSGACSASEYCSAEDGCVVVGGIPDAGPDAVVDAGDTLPPLVPLLFDPVWSYESGGGGTDAARDVALDALGNPYFVGNFDGMVDFGLGSIGTSGGDDGYLVALDPSGDPRYQQRQGGAGEDFTMGVCTDGRGRVYSTGFVRDDTDFGGGVRTLNGLTDAFLAGYTTDGVHEISLLLAGDTISHAHACDASGAGPIFVGLFEGDQRWGSVTMSEVGGGDAFVTALDPDGTPLWATSFGSTAVDVAYAVAMGQDGLVYVTGRVGGTTDFGGGPQAGEGGEDAFLAAFDAATGAHRWARVLGGALNDSGVSVAAMPGGGVVLTGTFEDSMDLGSVTLTSDGDADAFVARFDGGGDVLWVDRVGGPMTSSGSHVTVAGEDVFVCGLFDGQITIGDEALTVDGERDSWVAAYDAHGRVRGVHHITGPRNEHCFGLAADPGGRLFVAEIIAEPAGNTHAGIEALDF